MSQKRPTCHCGSQRFRRDAQTGRIVCEEGHILQGFVQESYEREIDTSHQHRARRLRKNKKGKAKIVSQSESLIVQRHSMKLIWPWRRRLRWRQGALLAVRMCAGLVASASVDADTPLEPARGTGGELVRTDGVYILLN